MTLAYATFAFAVFSLWGMLAVRRWAGFLRFSEQLALALVLGLIASCWVPFFAAKAFSFGFANTLIGLLGLALPVLARFRPGQFSFLKNDLLPALRHRRHWPVLLGLGAILAFHAWGHRLHALHDLNADGSWWSAGSGWEDYAFHAAVANSFLHGGNLQSFTYPHVEGWPMGYPFLPDFQGAWLAQNGSLPDAFFAGSVFASAAFLLGAFCLLRAWLGTAGRAFLALVLWHLGGGFGIAYLLEVKQQTGSIASAFLARDYANDWGLELNFHNLTTAVVWPMRVAFFGVAVVPALVLLLRGLIAKAATGGLGQSTLPKQTPCLDPAAPSNLPAFVLAGAAAGAMPLISSHSLVALACIVPPLALAARSWTLWRGWLAAVVAGAAVTVPQLLWMSRQLAKSEPPFVRFQPGWTAGWHGPDALPNYLSHMAWNTGLWISLGLFAWFLAGKTFRRETLGFWLILALGQVVVFQPYIFDNIKLFAIACLAPAAGCAFLLARGWERGGVSRVFAVALVPLLTASGLSSIVNETRHPALILDKTSLETAARLREATPRDAVILTATQLFHPVLIASGRQVVFANLGGMTLHGVPGVLDRHAEIGRIYEGASDARDLLKKHRVTWIVLGPLERLDYPKLNEPFLLSLGTVELTVGEWKLLKVKP